MTDAKPATLSGTEQRMLDALADAHPGWLFWIVHRVYGGPLWCAGRGELAEAHGDTAKHLADHIRLKLEDEADDAGRRT